VISQSFASRRLLRKGLEGFLEAADADGDMKEFACVIHQPGVGTYPVSITRIREGNQKSLSGYLYLNVNAFRNLDFVELTLTVQVRDRAGQFSEPVKFPSPLIPAMLRKPLPKESSRRTTWAHHDRPPDGGR